MRLYFGQDGRFEPVQQEVLFMGQWLRSWPK
jgi:hypothetical protein